MAKTVNKVTLLGRVGKDPEIRASQGGTAIASFSVATDHRVKDQGGNWKDETDWHSLVAFGRTAEIIRDYVRKGSQIYLEGRLQTRSWEANGERKYRTEIVVGELTLLGGGKGQDRSADPHGGYDRGDAYEGMGATDEDVPF